MNQERFNEIYNSLEYVGQDREEFFWLVNKVEEIEPSIILEVGVDKGGSLKFWEQIAKKMIIGIDLNNRISWDYKNSEKIVHFIESDSTDFSTVKRVKELLAGQELDFLYLDAEKSHVVHDFSNYYQFVREGGIIGFHDLRIGEVENAEGKFTGEGRQAQGRFFDLLKGRKEFIKSKTGVGTGIWYKEEP